jgi:hypothetical protein
MIKGSYNIYKNGEFVQSANNVITNFGKDAIWKYLCGSIPEWGGAIAVGTGPEVASVTNTRLDFEFSRNSTLLKSPSLSGSTRIITLKTSLEPNVSGIIKEVGVYNTLGPTNAATFDGRLISQFEEGVNESGEVNPLEWSYAANVTNDATNSRIGKFNIALDGRSTPALSYLGVARDGSNNPDLTKQGFLDIDLTKYSPLDSFEVAYQLLSVIENSGKTLRITLYDSQQTPASIYKEWTFDNPSATGYYSKTATLSDFTAGTGTGFNYDVSVMKVETNAHVSLDAFRIDDTDSTDTTYGLVSRAVLDVPITKKAGDSIDIEYRLALEL